MFEYVKKNKYMIFRILFFVALSILGGIAVIHFLCLTGNERELYTDIVCEWSANKASNSSAQRTLVYGICFAGIAVYAVFNLIVSALKKERKGKIDGEACEDDISLVIVGLIIMAGVYFILFYQKSWMMTLGLIVSLALLFLNKKLIVPGVTFMFMLIYAFCGIFRLYVFLGGNSGVQMKMIAIPAFIVTAIMYFCAKSGKAYYRGIMVIQLFIPFTLLVFLADRYVYCGNTVRIGVPLKVTVLIILMISVFIMESFKKLKENWADTESFNSILSYGAIVSIMTFNRFSGSGSVMIDDMHHPFENIIGYQQIIELGQKPFAEYIPVSGLYSVLHGFFYSFFGNDRMSNYYLSTNLFFLIVILAIACYIKVNFRAEMGLLVALLFLVTDYNRYVFVLPIMLLLSWPKLTGKKNLWLQVWFLTSYIHGLYYPVFGAAVAIGFIPLGIWIVYTYIKSGEFGKDVKTARFWVSWVICFIPVIFGIGLLKGTALHIKALGDQTIYSDGIARFGQFFPEGFLPLINNVPIRLVVYYLLSFWVIICIVWAFAAISFKNIILIKDPEAGFVSASCGIMMLVAFSYTLVRYDFQNILARNKGLVYAAFVMLILIAERYSRSGLEKKQYLYLLSL